jgi:phospholipid/cholesterol/gamma-HCH transport system substrate-binding protein
VKRAILIHRQDFIAVAALFVAAIAVVVYVLEHQPSFTFGQSYYTVRAPFSTAAAVTAGQGQAVTIAGVQVGQIGGVQLEGGRAVVTMNIYKKYAPIYSNATVLLRPRTPLKDMYLALDPGTSRAAPIPGGGELSAASTAPVIDTDQILSSLDADTRGYVLLLLAGGAQLFRDTPPNGSVGSPFPEAAAAPSPAAVADLRGTLKRFAPLGRDTRTFATLLATRRRNIRRAIHNLQLVSTSLGSVDSQLASLIRASNTNFSAISSQDANLQSALTLLPSTLQQTTQTLGKVQAFANQSGPTLQALLPFAHAFGPALQASQPLFRDTKSVIQSQLIPFSAPPSVSNQSLQPLAKTLTSASTNLSKATPKLSSSIGVLNALFNELAYQPRGGRQGYLFWGSWLSHIVANLASQQDAHGPIVRGLFMASCSTLNLLEVTLQQGSPSLGPLLDLLNAPDWSKIKSPFCPPGGLG